MKSNAEFCDINKLDVYKEKNLSDDIDKTINDKNDLLFGAIRQKLNDIISVCYRTVPKVGPKLLSTILSNHHTSVLEHCCFSLKYRLTYNHVSDFKKFFDYAKTDMKYKYKMEYAKESKTPENFVIYANLRTLYEIMLKNLDDENTYPSKNVYMISTIGKICLLFSKLLDNNKYMDSFISKFISNERIHRNKLLESILEDKPMSYDDDSPFKDNSDSIIFLDMKYENDKFHTFKIITNRGCLAEITRHRTLSFTVESTRYCNYNKKGFSYMYSNLVDPFSDKKTIKNNEKADKFIKKYLNENAKVYNKLISKFKLKPEQAREILPNALTCNMYVSGFDEDWIKFLDLRLTSNAHPVIYDLAYRLNCELNLKNDNL